MGFLGRLRVLGRKEDHLVIGIKVTTEATFEPACEEKEVKTLSIWTTSPYAAAAEHELPEILWDAAHSPEVLSIKASLLRDPTLDVLCRALFAAASSATDSSATVSAFSTPTVSTAVVKPLRAPRRLHLYDFKQIRGIGAGGCGNVYLVEHIPTRRQLAMKVIDKRFAREAQVLQEQRVLKDIGTKGFSGVMEFMGSFHNPRHYFLLTEYYPCGDLDSLIRLWGRLPMKLAKHYAAEILFATGSLHSLGYIHRDLKPENILLSETGHIVLSDFGFTKSVAVPGQAFDPVTGEHELLQTCCGTLDYMSPEQLVRLPYAFSTDVWSFAMIVFKMITGTTPWSSTFEESAQDIVQRMISGIDKWDDREDLDPQSRDFIKRMLNINAHNRATIEDIACDAWWGDINWTDIGSGGVPVPDVGSPSAASGSGDTEDSVFFGSFGGGGVYLESDDPHSDFNYTSSIFAAEGYEDSFTSDDEDTPSASFTDSFDDVPLGDTELSPNSNLERDVENDALVLSNAASSPLVSVTGCFTTTVTTTVTTTTDDESEIGTTVTIGVATMTQVKPTGFFRRLTSWLVDAASAISHFCSRLSLC